MRGFIGIRTRFLGPTETKGRRISTTTWEKRTIVGWDDKYSPYENHILAARAAARADGLSIVGYVRNNDGEYIWCCRRNPQK